MVLKLLEAGHALARDQALETDSAEVQATLLGPVFAGVSGHFEPRSAFRQLFDQRSTSFLAFETLVAL